MQQNKKINNIRAQSANVGTVGSSLKWLTCNRCGQGGFNDQSNLELEKTTDDTNDYNIANNSQ